jgi:beta-lactam-binding protein with PASTA domain
LKGRLSNIIDWIWYNKSRRDLIILFLIALAIIYCMILFADRVVMPIIVHRGGTSVVPNLVDLSLQQADSILSLDDLQLQIIAEETDTSRQPGSIMSQIPAPGTKIKEGRMVKVKVSKAEEAVIVPQLRGISVRQAELLLTQASLQLGEVSWVASDSFPRDVVIENMPSSGLSVPPGISVNIVASLGAMPDTVMMPDLVGKNIDEGRRMLQEIGLQIGKTKSKRNDDFLPGTVLDQSISPGDKVLRGTEVDLVVSKTESY